MKHAHPGRSGRPGIAKPRAARAGLRSPRVHIRDRVAFIGVLLYASLMSSTDTHFGFQTVPLGEKQSRVDDVFHKVASRYDLMNDLMSGGLHRAWKDVLVGMVRPSTTRPGRRVGIRI